MASDDTAPLFRRKPSPGARFGQGRILAWDPDTFENVVKWGGVELRDLPVLSGAEALTFAEGDNVTLVGLDQSGRRGAQSWGIWSRAIDPGSGAAEQAVAFMRGQIAKQISAEVFAERVHAAEAASLESTSSTTFVGLSGGPTLPGVEVSDSGKLIVLVGAEIIISPDQGATMSFEVSGDTAVAPSSTRGQVVDWQDPDVGSLASRAMAGVVLPVNPGVHTIAARYNKRLGTGSVAFINRSLIAIAL